MIGPVLSGILGERKVLYGISVDFFIKLKEGAETRARKGDMRRFGENMIV
jgi:hypothetical protein